MKILVLAAGTSTERDVSISSGSNVCRALRGRGHNAILVDVFFGCDDIDIYDKSENKFDIDDVVKQMKSDTDKVASQIQAGKHLVDESVITLAKKSDIVFLALHGSNGEDGKIQALFDLIGVKYTGADHLGSAMAMDKSITKCVLTSNGIPMPSGVVLTTDNRDKSIDDLGIQFPCVVKPACGGSSVGVAKCTNKDEYDAAVKEAFDLENVVLVERFIKGREFSIGILGHKALPVIEIVVGDGEFYDYINKYNGRPREVCPAPIDNDVAEKMQKFAEEASIALCLESYCRIDFLLSDDGEIYCLEANTLPGMTPTSLMPQEAAQIGMDYADLCEHLIELSLDKYKEK